MDVANATYEHDIQPLIQKYCFACHGNGKAADNVALDKYKTGAEVKAAARQWRAVKSQLDRKSMPPRQQPQPTDAERKLISDWIQSSILAG